MADLNTGVKYDAGKLRYDLVAWDALDEVARVYTYGARKYADRNWELGMSWGRVFAAVIRHLSKWAMGERLDDESGLPHLAHAAWGTLTLLAYETRRSGTDDRAPSLASELTKGLEKLNG
ncbi:MAG: dATP/dGTP diphosphohydrolase domain-containing protein [Terriglobia bacterium]